jgi:hypothetical protein
MWNPFKPQRADPPQPVERDIGRVRDGYVHRGPAILRDVQPGRERIVFLASAARALEVPEASLQLEANLSTAYGADELQIYECVQDAEDIWHVQLLPTAIPVTQFPSKLSRFPTLASIMDAAQSATRAQQPDEAL